MPAEHLPRDERRRRTERLMRPVLQALVDPPD